MESANICGAQGATKFLGSFIGEEAAARAYDKAAVERGRLDRLNFDDYELPDTIPDTVVASSAPRKISSRFRGVCWSTAARKWIVQLSVQGANKYLGSFDDEKGAARAYDKADIDHVLLPKLNFRDNDPLESALASPAPQPGSSQFQGVSLQALSIESRAQMTVQGRVPNNLVCFDDEEIAARGYDEGAIERGQLPKLNFDENEPLETSSASPAPKRRLTSQFRGVSRSARHKNWRAQIYGTQGVKYLGSFGDEQAAARAYEKAAIELGRLANLNFRDYNLPETAVASPAPQRGHSRFWGVGWNIKQRKWVSRLIVQGVRTYLGSFDNEEAAARAYDKAAIERGISTNLNFNDNEPPETASASSAPQKSPSRFRGVGWCTTARKWVSGLRVQGVLEHIGSFDDEEAVARAYDKGAIECGMLDHLNFNYDPKCAQSRESGESAGELVGC
jgi:hypothetical protein